MVATAVRDVTHPVDPDMLEGGGGYAIYLCNESSVAHTVSRVDVRLVSVVPYTAQLNVWAACDWPYSRQNGISNAGCGGGDPNNADLHAPFTSNATAGTVVTATQSSVIGSMNPLPVTLQPNEGMTVEVGMGSGRHGQLFSVAGTYTFSFGLTIDRSAPNFAVTSPPTLLAPPAHVWTGGVRDASDASADPRERSDEWLHLPRGVVVTRPEPHPLPPLPQGEGGTGYRQAPSTISWSAVSSRSTSSAVL